MEETTEPKKRRVKNKRPDLQLQGVINAAIDSLQTGDSSRSALLNTLVQVLSNRANRFENGKLRKAQQRVAELEAECQRLRDLLSQPISSEAERLRRLVAAAAHAPEVGGSNDVAI